MIRSENNLELTEPFITELKEVVEKRLGRFDERLTRVVAHLSDENGRDNSIGDDKRCMLEARPSGMDSLNVTHDAPTVRDAVSGAAKKLERVLDDTFGKLADR